MINLLKNQRGFGMLQAMIFAGIIAAGALVATRVINDLKLTQRGSATKDELEILHRSVESALQDSTNCTATRRGLLDGLAPSRVILADSANSTGQLADNPVIIQVGNVYGGNSVKVDSIAVNSANASWAASPDQQVVVTYSRLKSDEANRLGQGYGGKEVRRVIPITVIYGSAAEERCYADPKTGGNYYSSGSAQKFCQSLGSFMFWEPFQRKCIRNNHVCPVDHAFTGVDSNGAVICRRLSAAMNASNLFDTTAPTSCPGRTQLQLVVVGGKITIQCIASGSANLAWTPLTHDFGAVAIPGPSASQVFTLTNSGSAATAGCSAPTISDTTNFTLAPSGNCVGSNNLSAGGSCTVSISAIPQTSGPKTATLSRTCTTGGTAVTTTNMITANGAVCTPSLTSVSPTGGNNFSLDFAVGACGSLTVETSSSGSGPWSSSTGSCTSPRTQNTGSAGTWHFRLTNVSCSSTPSNIICVPATSCAAIKATVCTTLDAGSDGCGEPCGMGTMSCASLSCRYTQSTDCPTTASSAWTNNAPCNDISDCPTVDPIINPVEDFGSGGMCAPNIYYGLDGCW